MTRFQQLRAAFDAAIAEPDPERRERILVEACRGDAGMLAELREMLANEPADDFLAPHGDSNPIAGGQLGGFELLAPIGSGGSGVVWRARQATLDRDVAVKVMTAGPGTPAHVVERFHREPKAIAGVRHPHIVPVIADGSSGDTHWFAMELVAGHGLDVEIRVQRAQKPNDPQPLLPQFGTGAWFAAVARIVAEAADALHAAHGKGIVHRDIKPSNLLLDQDARLLVVDFGIARDVRFGELTDQGVIPGTWHYMSPEQARVANTPIDHRTDIYSLGVVMYELLTLTRPYEGKTAHEVFEKIRKHEPPAVRLRNRNVPRDLETICMAAIARDRNDRYASAGALRDDLRRFLGHEAITQKPPSWSQRLLHTLHRHRRALVLVAVVAATAFAALQVNDWLAARRARTAAEQAAREVLAYADLDHVAVDDLATRWLLLRSVAANEQIADARQRLSSYADELVRRMGVLTASMADPGLLEPRRLPAVEALSIQNRARGIFPEQPRMTEAVPADILAARVAIDVVDERGQPLAATLACVPIDARGMPGAEQPIGTAPRKNIRLDPGYYRFLVRIDSDERVFVRTLDDCESHAFTFPIWPVADRRAGMVRIAGGNLHLPIEGAVGFLEGRVAAVAPFWIDTCEVTVAQYRAFLTATNRKPPPYWERVRSPEHDRRPIAGVSWPDAAAYAEWAGKRLPSYPEWAIAARGAGPNPRRYPWLGEGIFGNCLVTAPTPLTREERHDAWLQHTTDVDASPASRTPEGLYEMLGNVSEWLESYAIDRHDGKLFVNPRSRIAGGLHWSSLAQEPRRDLGTISILPSTDMHYQYVVGFRCANSDAQ